MFGNRNRFAQGVGQTISRGIGQEDSKILGVGFEGDDFDPRDGSCGGQGVKTDMGADIQEGSTWLEQSLQEFQRGRFIVIDAAPEQLKGEITFVEAGEAERALSPHWN